ncbi:NADPH-dependent FMN reductase [Vibrio sp. VB16]|mgnify:CR=1 FL=1|uniref:NADPH-dependent FMN reductase n=1 Tax=Vibrio sp. VB16 TaxID=2785746 RepID=UPI00189E150F|nr:NAD(P)H-dependent oxidoreductase [Vibrio sp. VB16]UGA56773.1 NAD(P)H-dependent oxidoreductase [Vibrio sp. VB16]
MKVLAFAASSSKNSINKHLAHYAAQQIEGAQVELLDINDYELPLFNEDREKELGQPELAKAFYQKLGEADAIVISFAEHNGSYTAAYKNLFDWTSRISMQVFQNKPIIMLATSPGPGGASNVLAAAQGSAPHFAADVKGAISIPSFYDNFDLETGQLTNKAFVDQLLSAISQL